MIQESSEGTGDHQGSKVSSGRPSNNIYVLKTPLVTLALCLRVDDKLTDHLRAISLRFALQESGTTVKQLFLTFATINP